MKKILELIRKIAIIILTVFSVTITLSNYLNLHTFDIFNSNHYPRTYSILMIMIWLYILVLARKRIFEEIKKFKKSKINKIIIILTFVLILISLFSVLKVWAGSYNYTNLILFSFVDLVIAYIESNKKIKSKR